MHKFLIAVWLCLLIYIINVFQPRYSSVNIHINTWIQPKLPPLSVCQLEVYLALLSCILATHQPVSTILCSMFCTFFFFIFSFLCHQSSCLFFEDFKVPSSPPSWNIWERYKYENNHNIKKSHPSISYNLQQATLSSLSLFFTVLQGARKHLLYPRMLSCIQRRYR